jgi:hypothetical protein
MATMNGKAIPVWYSEEDRSRVEEAAVLAGYKHLSKYIRDKSLERGRYRTEDRDGPMARADIQELLARLTGLEHGQKTIQSMLAMLLFLMRRKATTGDINDMRATIESAALSADPLAVVPPELAALLDRFMEDA